MLPAERLERFLLFKGIDFFTFANIIGFGTNNSHKYVGKPKENKTKMIISKKYAPKFHLAGLNYLWYASGEGEMLTDGNIDNNTKPIIYNHNFDYDDSNIANQRVRGSSPCSGANKSP